MRKTTLPNIIKAPHHALNLWSCAPRFRLLKLQTTSLTPCRTLAQVRSDRALLPEVWFTSSSPPQHTPKDFNTPPPQNPPPPDERTLKLGKTLRTLQTLLPTLLASPLPPEILSPNITLHLFPSTHPHLPTVSGRVAYHAALWTAPISWGRLPILGNVRLNILSERILRTATTSPSTNTSPEKLLVRWQTSGKTRGKGMGAFYKGIGASEQVDKITEWLGGDVRDDEEFTGLFIFEFDAEGRIGRHTIEHVGESGVGEGMSRVVSVTDWLLGRMNGRGNGRGELAWSCVGNGRGRGVERWR